MRLSHLKKLVLVTLLATGAPALAESTDGGEAPGSAADAIWLGPHAFVEGRTVRDDFIPVLTDADRWPSVLQRTDVFKGYLMMLPTQPVPGRDEPELSDAQLRRLIEFLDAHELKVAFEVGGPRSAEPGAGRRAAENEFAHLRRWLELGGRIDYLTTDHSLMRGLDAWLEANNPQTTAAMSLRKDPELRELFEDLSRELATYFQVMSERIPGVKLGVIESLGYFAAEGPDGRAYEPTRPEIPELPVCAVLEVVQRHLDERDLELDHFHLDYGYEGVHFDGQAQGRLDHGRLLAVETCLRSLEVRSGVIVNAFHDGFREPDDDPEPAEANRQAVENTRRFFETYLQAGGQSEQIVLQTWQPYPDRTGPETDPHTVVGMFHQLLTHEAFPTPEPVDPVSPE